MRDRHNPSSLDLANWRDAAIEALRDAGGSLTPRDLALRSGLNDAGVASQRAKRFPAYFTISGGRNTSAGLPIMIRLHKHIAQFAWAL